MSITACTLSACQVSKSIPRLKALGFVLRMFISSGACQSVNASRTANSCQSDETPPSWRRRLPSGIQRAFLLRLLYQPDLENPEPLLPLDEDELDLDEDMLDLDEDIDLDRLLLLLLLLLEKVLPLLNVDD